MQSKDTNSARTDDAPIKLHMHNFTIHMHIFSISFMTFFHSLAEDGRTDNAKPISLRLRRGS